MYSTREERLQFLSVRGAKNDKKVILLKCNLFYVLWISLQALFPITMRVLLTFILFLLYLNSSGKLYLNSNRQPSPKRDWVNTKVIYTSSTKRSTIFTNSLPKGGGLVHHNGKEYNYFIFWASIRNESDSPLELQIKFPKLNFFNSDKSHFKVAFTKTKMTFDKVQDFDYGLTDIPSLLNIESNQLKSLKCRVLPKNEYLFYIPIFINKTKWPVRAEFILKDKKLFYKITAGTDSVMVPCGGINFLN